MENLKKLAEQFQKRGLAGAGAGDEYEDDNEVPELVDS